MIKFMQCTRRKIGLSVQDFRKYWQEYEEKVQRVADLSGAVRVTFNTTLTVDANLKVMAVRGTTAPYDGVVEVEWERAPNLAVPEEGSELRAAVTAMREFQEEFIDLDRSSFFFTSAHDLEPTVELS